MLLSPNLPLCGRAISSRLLLRNVLFQLRLIIAAVILGNFMDSEAISDADNEEQPKEVERLERAEQGERDDEGEVALVLLSLPVELVRADGLELGEQTQ